MPRLTFKVTNWEDISRNIQDRDTDDGEVCMMIDATAGQHDEPEKRVPINMSNDQVLIVRDAAARLGVASG